MTGVKGRLHFTVGCARSGKSTYCNKWVRQVEDMKVYRVGDDPSKYIGFPRAVVAGDDFRLALHGQAYSKLAEGTVFAMMDVAARALLSRGFDVIMDETATTEETIKRYLNIDIDAVPVVIDTPLEVCLERAVKTNQEYLLGPIRRHHAQLTKLTKDFEATMSRLRQEVVERWSK